LALLCFVAAMALGVSAAVAKDPDSLLVWALICIAGGGACLAGSSMA
jgi:hypothetical protein